MPVSFLNQLNSIVGALNAMASLDLCSHQNGHGKTSDYAINTCLQLVGKIHELTDPDNEKY